MKDNLQPLKRLSLNENAMIGLLISNIIIDGTDDDPVYVSKDVLYSSIINMFNGNANKDNIVLLDYNNEEDKVVLLNNYERKLNNTVSENIECFLDKKGQLKFCFYSESCSHVKKFNGLYFALQSIYNLTPKTYQPSEQLMSFDLDERVFKPASKHVNKVIKDAVEHFGIVSNKQVLDLGIGRFLLLFPSSYYDYLIDFDTCEYNAVQLKEYITYQGSTERFCEILYSSLLKSSYCPYLYDLFTQINLGSSDFDSVVGFLSI